MAIAAVAMMDNRKRPLEAASVATGASSNSSAKRIQLDPPPSSLDNHPSAQQVKVEGDNDEADEANPAYKGLESYRKEAIFRQMREAQRDVARASRKIKSLQQSLDDMHERTGAFNQFWDLLIEDIRILFQSDPNNEAERSVLYDVIPFTVGQPSKGAFSASVQERGRAIRTVLSRLASVAPRSPNSDIAQLQARCHQLASEASQLRQQAADSDRDLLTSRHELSVLTDNLRRAERRVDRLQSRSVLLSERPSTKAEKEAEQAKVQAAEAERKAAEQRKEAAEAKINGVHPVAAADSQTSATLREEFEHANSLAQARLDEAKDLRTQILKLRQECERLQLDLYRIPDDRTRETPLYRDLHGHYTHAQQELERYRGIYEALEAENVDLRERRVEFQTNAQIEASALADSLREQLKAKDADVVRLRSQRDDALGDVSEKKQRESVKFYQCDEMKQLVASKDLRIETLRSEVRRLQMALAASTEDKTRLEAVKARESGHGPDEDELTLIESLTSRLKAAEQLSADLKRQLDARSSSTSEADLLAKISSLQADLDSLNGILRGVSSEEEAIERLKEQSGRISRLEAELTAANESTNALCEEVEKLSKAYADMDRQASSKVMDLSKMEDKVLRLTTEKAKADNKYFAAMRAKDALENDRRAVLRTVERQVKVIERYAEQEAQFTQHLINHEREVTSMRRMISGYTARIAEIERDLRTSRMRESESTQYRAHAEERLQVAISEAEAEKAKRVRLEEQFAKIEREIEKAKKQASAASAAAAAAGVNPAASTNKPVAESEVDFLQALLRCSSCKDRYRDKIITRCMHTYCSPCIEARIQTRQRKCPHCGIPFAVSEVQPLYFQ